MTRDEDGFALLTVLLGMAVLAVLVAAIGMLAGNHSRHAHNLAEAAKAEALADGGVHHAIRQVRHLVKESAWRADGAPMMLRLDDGEVETRVSDEAGRIDLNFADEELLRALLIGAGAGEREADALKDAILDWTDQDDLRRLNGAEAAEYRAAHLPAPGNRPFAMVEELRLVKGMTPSLLRRLAPFVTVHARQRGIDPTVAAVELLATLSGMTADQLGAAARQQGVDAVALGQSLGLAPQFVAISKRQVVAIRAEGRTPQGGIFVRDCIVRLMRDPANPILILAWRKGRPEP